MRGSSILLLLTLALSVSSAPTNQVSRLAPRVDNEDRGDGFPFLTKESMKIGHTKKTKILCDSPQSDVRGAGTGRSPLQVWEDAEMDKFLYHLDNFIPGGDPPFGKYTKSLPITLGDLTNIFDGWKCKSNECTVKDFSSVGQCEESEVGAQAWKTMQSLANFQTFMDKFTEHVRYQGSLVALQAAALVNKLDPVELATDNAGWAIYLSAILGSVASWMYRSPKKQAIVGFAGAIFGFATATITEVGNENDQRILDRIYKLSDIQNETVTAFDLLSKEIGKMTVKVLEDVPENWGDKPYSESEFSAVKLLEGGTFVDIPPANTTDSLAEELHKAATQAIITGMWGSLVIGKLTKKLLDTEPCKLKGNDDQFPKEFMRLCVGDTAYFFANGDSTPKKLEEPFKALPDRFKKFWKDEDRDLYAGVRPVDIINESSNSEKAFGWNRLWDASKELMDTLLDHAQNPDKGKLSPFNFPILELDLADGDPPPRDRNPRPGYAKLNWGSTHALDHERLRFMMFQAMREQKDSHGNSYPYETAKNIKWHMYPYTWDGQKRP